MLAWIEQATQLDVDGLELYECLLTATRGGDGQGVAWAVPAITELLPLARELDVVLALENHDKDGYWTCPEFAQRPELFHRILDAIDERDHFGVQFDPSDAITAGVDGMDEMAASIGIPTREDRAVRPVKALVKFDRGDRQVEVRDVPEPAAAPGRVLVRVEVAGGCGRDASHPATPSGMSIPTR